MNPPPLPATVTPVRSSAAKAGWICFVLGLLTFWMFGLGFAFLAAAIVLAVVAMCTNQVGQGIALLVSSLVSLVVCVLIFVLVILGGLGLAVQKVYQHEQQQRLKTFLNSPTPTPHK